VADRTAGAPLSGRELPALLARVHDALTERRDALDDLNVFPVPDGDTGTNMALTVRAGLEALHRAMGPPDELARAVIRGAVRGARGNSGVILSQVVRAVVEVLTGRREVDTETYARALEEARKLAYDAVAEPVEGTILTAISAASFAAVSAAEEGLDLVAASARIVAATADAVERTQYQLDVLTEAGVVDAGARGFEVVLAAVHGHLTGEDAPVVHDEARPQPAPSADGAACHGSLQYRFEVQYLLDADDEAAPPLRRRLEDLGDSVVVVAAGGLLNVHVHTDDVGAAIEEGLRYGTPSDIEVTHFGDQIAARRAAHPPTQVGVVAVLHGDGLGSLARELGAVVVEGAAGSLPSVADLLNAVGMVRAQRVAILPGHRNAMATAYKTVDVAVAEGGRPLDVIEPATSPPAILAALAVLDPMGPAEQVLADLTAAAAAVRVGEVVAAIRDADTPVGPVRAGQLLAVTAGKVLGAFDEPLDALAAVCDAVAAADAEVVTLLLGADVGPDERTRALDRVGSLVEGELEAIDAGCRPSRYWVGVE
jgi:uncharacterized protein